MATKVAIVGSRNFQDYEKFKEFVLEVLEQEKLDLDDITIVSGGARGADFLAEKFAKEFGIPILIFPAKWKRFGKKAGHLRNQLIVNEADLMIAFPLPGSKGTWDSLNRARKKGIKIYIFELAEPEIFP